MCKVHLTLFFCIWLLVPFSGCTYIENTIIFVLFCLVLNKTHHKFNLMLLIQIREDMVFTLMMSFLFLSCHAQIVVYNATNIITHLLYPILHTQQSQSNISTTTDFSMTEKFLFF